MYIPKDIVPVMTATNLSRSELNDSTSNNMPKNTEERIPMLSNRTTLAIIATNNHQKYFLSNPLPNNLPFINPIEKYSIPKNNSSNRRAIQTPRFFLPEAI